MYVCICTYRDTHMHTHIHIYDINVVELLGKRKGSRMSRVG